MAAGGLVQTCQGEIKCAQIVLTRQAPPSSSSRATRYFWPTRLLCYQVLQLIQRVAQPCQDLWRLQTFFNHSGQRL